MGLEYYGIKELYDLTLKTTIPVRVGNRNFESGEPILYFDKAIISIIEEDVSRAFATGGKGDPNLIMWEDTRAVSFSLQEGVMSRLGFAMLTNAKVMSRDESLEFVTVPKRQILETDENGRALLQNVPSEKFPTFIYDNTDLNLTKIENFLLNGREIIVPNYPLHEIMVVYYFDYHNKFDVYHIGEKLFNGYLKLEAKVYWKEDQQGANKTSLFEMPRVRLTSQLTLRIGERANPVVSTFTIIGFPNDVKKDRTICKLTLLDEDVDFDIY